ncbi:toll/interleukin-1 receptor domain-containing protein [Amycolatopsis sp. NBC_00348]|uniref:TIR domain-containing protein n=1 Tax=Amycolatopsis sp. NBC_00348 TaxID=2975956 RepID=UPI002E27248C
MSSIFMSYRRNPQGTAVAAIADGLQRYFGTEEVFIDNGIVPGDQYPDALESRLQACTVLIAVIHEGWEDSFKERRHKDWVLHEIRTALERRIHVIPVPIGNASMPEWTELPAEISELAHRQAAPVGPATYTTDLNNLIRQLEKHVAPATAASEDPAPRRKRLWLRLLISTISLFALTPILFFTGGETLWELFARPAAISAVVLALASTLATTLVVALKPLTDRWEKSSGIQGVRKMFALYWIAPALIVLASLSMSIHALTEDDNLNLWKISAFAAFLLIAFWVLSFWFQRTADRDEEWPPPVTTEHAVFRRAAHRLEQRLVDGKKSRKDYTKADRQDAELILSRLDGARKELDHRARASMPAWIKSGYRSEAVAYLSWFASIVALEVVATGVSVFGEPAPRRSLLAAGLTIAIAAIFTMAGLSVNCLLDRRNSRRWSSEIMEWQQKLATMVHEHGAMPGRGRG